jgi:hypothetical protein
MESESKLKGFLLSSGVIKLKCTLNKDVFFPRDTLHLDVIINNEKCKKKCEKFTCRILRRVEVYNLEKNKFLFGHD